MEKKKNETYIVTYLYAKTTIILVQKLRYGIIYPWL